MPRVVRGAFPRMTPERSDANDERIHEILTVGVKEKSSYAYKNKRGANLGSYCTFIFDKILYSKSKSKVIIIIYILNIKMLNKRFGLLPPVHFILKVKVCNTCCKVYTYQTGG